MQPGVQSYCQRYILRYRWKQGLLLSSEIPRCRELVVVVSAARGAPASPRRACIIRSNSVTVQRTLSYLSHVGSLCAHRNSLSWATILSRIRMHRWAPVPTGAGTAVRFPGTRPRGSPPDGGIGRAMGCRPRIARTSLPTLRLTRRLEPRRGPATCGSGSPTFLDTTRQGTRRS